MTDPGTSVELRALWRTGVVALLALWAVRLSLDGQDSGSTLFAMIMGDVGILGTSIGFALTLIRGGRRSSAGIVLFSLLGLAAMVLLVLDVLAFLR